MLDKTKVKLGIAPIAWTNDDMPDLGKENTFEQCVSEMALAGFSGCEVGNKYPKDREALKKALDLRGLTICNRWFSSFLITKPFEETANAFAEDINKTTQAGLIAHYTAIANAVSLPCIIYNVPSRTGVNVKPETLAELCKLPNINGVKEASSDIVQIAEVAELCGDELNIYSGNDNQIVPVLSLGGKGVISVLSNVAPQMTHDICQLWFDGNHAESLRLQLQAMGLVRALFKESNPIPVKWAMNRLGWKAGGVRLPLVDASPAVQQMLETELKKNGLL